MPILCLLLLGLLGFGVGSANAQNLKSIADLRSSSFPGSTLTLERTLVANRNYNRYIASYLSEGLKIYGLLTVPRSTKPRTGWPVIIFNHGYIPPKQYRTTERYVAYVDGFARSGYVVFKPDFRGHGSSQGEASGAYWSEGYLTDVLNAVSTLATYPSADPARIGMWGHSMGGYLTLRAMVIDKRIKAGVIWAGVVAPYQDLLFNWRRTPPNQIPPGALSRRKMMLERYGTPTANPKFWDAVTSNNFLSSVKPIQIHHGTADSVVPLAFSQTLARQLDENKRTHTLYTYPGDDHNLSKSLPLALRRSVGFFDRYVKSIQP
jgi:uncharacterized protein